MNYLDRLGMGDMLEDESFFMHMMQEICENGIIFHGYYGFYIWERWFGILELNCHVEPDGDRNVFTGFTTHISSNCFWHLAVADTQPEPSDEEEGETYVMERVYDFVDPKSDNPHESVHISLVNADVIPDYHSGDLITMQVSAIASNVSYYPDEEAYTSHPITTIMGRPVLFAPNRVSNILGGSIAAGTIQTVRHFTFCNLAREEVPVYYIDVDTQYGTLTIVHRASLVEEGQREYIRPGAFIKAICDIQGDVAIGDYQRGAIIDEDHLVALLHSCFVEKDFTRLSRQVAEDCQYIGRDGEIRADGKEEVVAFMKEVMDSRDEYNEPCYAWIGEVTGHDLEVGEGPWEDLPPVGTHCILLAQNKERKLDCVLFLVLNEKRKIKKICSAGDTYASCLLKVIRPLPDDKKDDIPEKWERVNVPHTEPEWLDILASAYKGRSFQDAALYYGFAVDCDLKRQPGGDSHMDAVSDRESMYDHLKQNLEALPDATIEAIDGAPWGHTGALRITSPQAELIAFVTLNEEGYIQTMHEIWQ